MKAHEWSVEEYESHRGSRDSDAVNNLLRGFKEQNGNITCDD